MGFLVVPGGAGAWADMRFSSPERWVLWNHLDDIAAYAVVLGAWAIPLLFLALLLYAQETRRVGRWFAGAMLCFWATFAHLVPTTWYVRPTAGEYGAEDGSSYANAFDGASDITWGVGGVQAGDTLYVCGTHYEELAVGGSGSAGNHITISGECPNDSGLFYGAEEMVGTTSDWTQPYPSTFPNIWSELDLQTLQPLPFTWTTCRLRVFRIPPQAAQPE